MSGNVMCSMCGRDEPVSFCLCSDTPVYLCPSEYCNSKHEAHKKVEMQYVTLYQLLGRNKEEFTRRIDVSTKLKEFVGGLRDRVCSAKADAEARFAALADSYHQQLHVIENAFSQIAETLDEEIHLFCTQAESEVSPITKLLIEKVEELAILEDCFFIIPEKDTLASMTKRCKDACSRSKKLQSDSYLASTLSTMETRLSPSSAVTPSSLDEASYRKSTTLTLIPTDSGERPDPVLARTSTQVLPKVEQVPDYLSTSTRSILLRLGHYPTLDHVEELVKKPPAVVPEGVYTGQWNVHNQKHGNGTLVYQNGSIYEGDWKGGERDGKGRFVSADGLVYIGDWVQGKRHGRGVAHSPNGDTYNGEFANDKMQGCGIKKYHEGDLYIGEFAEDLLNGHGKYVFSNGNMYTGLWKGGVRNGKFMIGNTDGSLYFGDLSQGLRSGSGISVTASLQVYKGSWANNKMEGQGKLVYRMEIVDCLFRDNLLSGEGVVTLIDGRRFRCHCDKGVIVQYLNPV